MTQMLVNKVPAAAWLLPVLLAPLALSGANATLGALALMVLVLGIKLLWRTGEPPVLLLLLFISWLQASLLLLKANLAGQEVATFDQMGGDLPNAIRYSLWSLLAMSLGMRAALGSWRPVHAAEAREHLMALPPEAWFKLYLLAWGVSLASAVVVPLLPPLRQLVVGIESCRWAFFGVLTWAAFVQRGRLQQFWVVAFLLELVYGLTGYFSGFKTVFMVTLLFVLAAGLRFTLGRTVVVTLVGAVAIVAGIAWTAIKVDYRDKVSGGSGLQVTSIPVTERLSTMSDMLMALTLDDLGKATDGLVSRFTYVEYFARVLNVVPDRIPHEDGAIWGDAIARPFMPRLLFPDKTSIDDSERTATYTQMNLIGTDDGGTSISLGWVAEAYIDFGVPGMFGLAFLLGGLLGFIYRRCLEMPLARGVWGAPMAMSTMLGALFLETSITKMVGGLLVCWLTVWLVLRYVMPRYVPWALWSGPPRHEP